MRKNGSPCRSGRRGFFEFSIPPSPQAANPSPSCPNDAEPFDWLHLRHEQATLPHVWAPPAARLTICSSSGALSSNVPRNALGVLMPQRWHRHLSRSKTLIGSMRSAPLHPLASALRLLFAALATGLVLLLILAAALSAAKQSSPHERWYFLRFMNAFLQQRHLAMRRATDLAILLRATVSALTTTLELCNSIAWAFLFAKLQALPQNLSLRLSRR